MSNNVETIDPAWAWQPFEPDSARPWNLALAAHLYRRAGFAASWPELEAAAEMQPQQVVRRLLEGGDDAASFQDESRQFADTILASGDPQRLSAWWVYTMLRTPHPLLEKTTLFWHGHFATSADKVQAAAPMLAQNRLLREHALGNFAHLTHAIARDPAMLVYLDSVTNRKAHPNENFARELMELFCLGEGNYTEQDVQQLARCFTGWEIRRFRFRFNRYQHDAGDKTILGQSGTFPDAEAIDVVLAQPDAPRFIVRKLVHYFVWDEPAVPEALIEPLANELRENQWDVAPTIARILGSNLFFSSHAVGRKIRSPVELVVGSMRALEGSANAGQLANHLVELGQGLFYPPNVKGWEGGRAWINASTLLGRANVVGTLMRDPHTRFGGEPLEAYFARLGATSHEDIIDRLISLTVAAPVPLAARAQLTTLLVRPGERSERIAATIHALSTLPEFQLG